MCPLLFVQSCGIVPTATIPPLCLCSPMSHALSLYARSSLFWRKAQQSQGVGNHQESTAFMEDHGDADAGQAEQR